MGQRYSRITGRFQREIVLLKSFPCKYGKCSFCNYILDNSTDEDEINNINSSTLAEVTGEIGILEVINSGSVFELPQATLHEIRNIATEKGIHTIYFEIYYSYKNRLEEIRTLFNSINIRFRMGIETFDDNFRINVYNKRFRLKPNDYEWLSQHIYSVCLLICVDGQTRDMIESDIQLALKYFSAVTINVFVDNGTKVKRNEELYQWFLKKHRNLQHHNRIEMLLNNQDLGVFEQ